MEPVGLLFPPAVRPAAMAFAALARRRAWTRCSTGIPNRQQYLRGGVLTARPPGQSAVTHPSALRRFAHIFVTRSAISKFCGLRRASFAQAGISKAFRGIRKPLTPGACCMDSDKPEKGHRNIRLASRAINLNRRCSSDRRRCAMEGFICRCNVGRVERGNVKNHGIAVAGLSNWR